SRLRALPGCEALHEQSVGCRPLVARGGGGYVPLGSQTGESSAASDDAARPASGYLRRTLRLAPRHPAASRHRTISMHTTYAAVSKRSSLDIPRASPGEPSSLPPGLA